MIAYSLRCGEELGVTSYSFWDNENVLQLDSVMAAQVCEYTNNHRIVHFQGANVCKLYVNNFFLKCNWSKQEARLLKSFFGNHSGCLENVIFETPWPPTLIQWEMLLSSPASHATNDFSLGRRESPVTSSPLITKPVFPTNSIKTTK